MDNKNVRLHGTGSGRELLQFLRSKNCDRFTKLDAFCDLIGRMDEQSKKNKTVKDVDRSPLAYGEFTGTISELAHDWHWHRATVRTFLDGLEKQGLLKRQLNGLTYTFQLRIQSGVSVPVCSGESVRALGYFLLHHWDEYSLPADVLAMYFEEYEAMAMDNYQGNDLAHDLAELKAETILETFRHLEFAPSETYLQDEAICQMVTATFTAAKPWSWTKWMRALQYLDLALLGDEFPEKATLDMEETKVKNLMADFSDDDIRLLGELFYAVKKKEDPATDAPEPVKPFHSSLPSKETE